ETLVTRLRQLAASWRHPGRIDREVVLRASPAGFSLQCIGIGASTGGIHTLGELLSGFTAPPGVPILITQHLPEPFIRYYVQQVSRMIDLPVQIAVEGTILRPDHVYVAPGESSLSCQRFGSVVRAVLLPQRDPATQARPSVNFMFSAMAECYGDGALGIVLTGIGRDGTFGAGRIVDAGGAIVAQDRDSSVVWGMPGSVTRAGFACANLQPDEMPGYIARLAGAES
ncbi:MAG: CheB methylesterase domain-containing protein, partial [Sphingobium sp.]